ncbi:ABC transporter permease [Actinophytocola oryzae]|uniref:ABC-2 type transport system permease protein n=1 Tax=Actinophytocola oryzae TaxID=502181 RepID=A0A4R7VYZ8_9PSEU|nr:ABC transporter permease [Actinophytocola oryzae]TDV54898.1 ABC-2 type transport system permease protein [Actinophytocola oryzae]
MTGFTAATRLVAERELRSFLRSKGTWIGLGVIVVLLFAISILPKVIGGGPDKVAAVGADAARVLDGTAMEVTRVSSVAAAEKLVRDEEVEAAIVPDTSGDSVSGVRVVALDDQPTGVVAKLATAPPVALLEQSAVSKDEQRIVIQVFAVVFMLFAMGGVAIAQSTVVEKQTRIVEILVSTIPVRAMLAGKIVGHSLLTLGQVVVLAVATPIALSLGGQTALLSIVAPALGWFVPFMCLGFVLLAAVWAVAGSLVSRQEDLGSTTGVVMLLVMGPYFLVSFFSDNATVMTVMSYVPFSAAVAMPVRLFADEAQLWEPLVSLGLLVGSVVLIVLLASRVYSGSLLQTGGKVALAKAWAHVD